MPPINRHLESEKPTVSDVDALIDKAYRMRERVAKIRSQGIRFSVDVTALTGASTIDLSEEDYTIT